MRNKIINPEIAKTAKFLQCSLIPADLLKPKKELKYKINNWQTEHDELSLSDPTNTSIDPISKL